MFCTSCGQYCTDTSKFCPNCGASITETFASQSSPGAHTSSIVYSQSNVLQSPVDYQPGKGYAIASLVTGILSLLCCIPIISSILAIVFFAVARRQGNKSGMAIAGLVCGIIGLVLVLMVFSLAFSESFWEGFWEGYYGTEIYGIRF